MSSLSKILNELNSLTCEEKAKLNGRLLSKSNNFGLDPVECIKECVIEINSLQFEDEKRRRIQVLIDEINDRNARKAQLLRDTSYFEWLVDSCKENEGISSFISDNKGNFSEDDIEKIKDISIFYDAVRDYANDNNIDYYIGDDATNAYYHVRHNHKIVTFGAYVYGGGIFCHISEGFELRMDNEEAIELVDIINYFQNKREEDGSQRSKHKPGIKKEVY